MPQILRITLAAVVLFGTMLMAESARAEGPQKITSVEGITEYRLENGLKVLLFPDPSKPTVTVNLTVFCGSRHEGYGETGMAHLLEHMLFKGTPTHKDIPKELQSRGARFNGTTWLDRTNYYETLPANDDNLEFAIRLEADRMVNSLIKAEDLESEMTVVRSEFERGENNPSLILMQRMMSAAFLWHNYGKSTIGNRADIERVPVENLRAFYRKYYQPDNAMLVVAGQFEPEKALEYVQKYFGSIPKPERELPQTYTEEPPQDGERYVTLRRVGDVAVVGAVYHIPAGPHPQFAAVDVLSTILADSPSGRLYKALVETKKAASIRGGSYALHDPGVLLLLAEVSEGNEPQVVLDTMLDVVEQVDEKGVTKEETERAKRELLKQFELAATDSSQIAIELSEWAAQGDWRLYFLYRDRVEQVTPKAVQEAARQYLVRNNRTVGTYFPLESPARVSIPQTPDLAEMIGDYKGREALAQGEAFDVSPENIEKRTERFTLPSGVKAAFLPKETRGESVVLRLTLRYGNESNLQNRQKAAEFLPALMKRGTEQLTRQELDDALDKNRVQLGTSGSPGVATFTIETKRPNLPAALDLLEQVLRQPALPESELEILKQAQIAQLEQQLTEPSNLAVTAVRRELSPYPKGDPRYVPTITEEIEAVKALDVAAIETLYREYLGAAHGELTVVGDFDPEKTRSRISEMLADWQPSKPYARITLTGEVNAEGGLKSIVTPGKANAMYFASTIFEMKDDHPDYPAVVLGNYILGGGSLSSRLGDRVRQKEGLSYGVGSNFQASSLDERAALYAYAISNPQNMDRVVDVIREEIDLLLKKGITDQELETAKQGFLQRQKVARTDDGNLAQQLAETSYVGRTMQYQAELEEKIRDLTAGQVVEALRKHFDPDRLVIVTAGDFQKGKPAETSDEK